jgi:hypothetical protein
MSGSDQFNALSDTGHEAQFSGPSTQDVMSGTESESDSEPTSDFRCKKRDSGNHAQSKRP